LLIVDVDAQIKQRNSMYVGSSLGSFVTGGCEGVILVNEGGRSSRRRDVNGVSSL
jgi:hypothetical protein